MQCDRFYRSCLIASQGANASTDVQKLGLVNFTRGGEPFEICSIKPMTGFYRDRCYKSCALAHRSLALRNETVRTFLLKEFEKFSFGYRADGTAPIQNKVGAFLADPMLNRILTASEQDLHIRRIVDQGQVPLVNLAKGHIGEDSSSLLGGLLVTTIGLAAFSRARNTIRRTSRFLRLHRRVPKLYDPRLGKHALGACKYRVGFTVAHQYLHQLEPDVRHAVLGNVGSIISFRVGVEDASYLVREFQEKFAEIDLLQLPNYRIYLKLMIEGTPSNPLSAITLDPQAR